MHPDPRRATALTLAALLTACGGTPVHTTTAAAVTTPPPTTTEETTATTAEPDAAVETDAATTATAEADAGTTATSTAETDAGTTASNAAETDAGPPAEPATTATAATAATTAPAAETYRGLAVDPLLHAMASNSVARVVTHTSSTNSIYELDLGNDVLVAFKPDHGRFRDWWRHEVAAYRLARLLGIQDHVPPSVARRVPYRTLHNYLPGDDLLPARDDRNAVAGSATFWMPRLVRTPLSDPSQENVWSAWLDPRHPVPAAHDQMAREIATVLVFDYLCANEDRWNEANFRLDEFGHVIFRDNNNGWFEYTLRDLSWGQRRLHLARRFSRRFVAALEQATGEALRAELARDPGTDHPILNDRQIELYERRRQSVLAWVHRVVEQYGEDHVMVWE